MNRTNIEFCDFTWNPIVGCFIGCPYCWARKMNSFRRFIPHFNDPVFFPERLKEPYERKKPAKIFICSMADIFCGQIEWFDRIMKVCKENPQHTFQILTKRPEFLQMYEKLIPSNCWIGTSIDKASTGMMRVKILSKCSCRFTKFVLVEPLLSRMDRVDFSEIDFVYIGAMTGPKPLIPMKEWIYSVEAKNIIYKENIKKYL